MLLPSIAYLDIRSRRTDWLVMAEMGACTNKTRLHLNYRHKDMTTVLDLK